jgi:hypothetical protein
VWSCAQSDRAVETTSCRDSSAWVSRVPSCDARASQACITRSRVGTAKEVTAPVNVKTPRVVIVLGSIVLAGSITCETVLVGRRDTVCPKCVG